LNTNNGDAHSAIKGHSRTRALANRRGARLARQGFAFNLPVDCYQGRRGVAQNTAGFATMAGRAGKFWRKAKQFAAVAQATTNPDTKRIYDALEQKWREMAQRAEELERRIAERRSKAVE
jgi:hypothetical protein